MSEWNYTKCSKPFNSIKEALDYMITNSFDGQVLERSNGYSAVCPTYPEGFYPDAVPVAEYSPELGVVTDKKLFGVIMVNPGEDDEDSSCCPIPVSMTNKESKCC